VDTWDQRGNGSNEIDRNVTVRGVNSLFQFYPVIHEAHEGEEKR
jgi:hypothetical protein